MPKRIRMEVFQDKVTKILRISEVEEFSIVHSKLAQDQKEEQEVNDNEGPWKILELRIPQIVISVISCSLPKGMPRQEFLLICFNDIMYLKKTCNNIESHQFTIGSLQIDNNLCEEACK